MTIGVVKVSHFCMDRLATVSFFDVREKLCDKCGMQKEEHGCCHDEKTLVKVDTDHYKTTFRNFKSLHVSTIPVLTSIYLFSSLTNGSFESLLETNISPPLYSQNEVYIRNRVFRI